MLCFVGTHAATLRVSARLRSLPADYDRRHDGGVLYVTAVEGREWTPRLRALGSRILKLGSDSLWCAVDFTCYTCGMQDWAGGGSKEELRRVRSSWPSRGWTWDERHGSVASSFSVANKDEYEAILAQVFPACWDHRTITRAPDALVKVAASTGGVRHGQLLFSPENSSGVFAYALWWPWGDDTTISVRMALAPDGEMARATLRDVFGVDPQG